MARSAEAALAYARLRTLRTMSRFMTSRTTVPTRRFCTFSGSPADMSAEKIRRLRTWK